MASVTSSARQATATRATLVLAGLLLIVTSVWFAASWIDTGDSTCASVFRPDVWTDDGTSGRCSPAMPIRAGIAATVAGAGLALLYAALARRRLLHGRSAALVLVGVILGAAILLLINEEVRRGGGI